LKKKKNIQSLGLSWSESVMEEEEFVSNLRVLDALEPPSEIKELEIKGYRGFHLPCWMSRQSDSSCLETALLCQTSQPRFLCLVELRLYRLPNLEHMQRILVLPSLKTLLLWDMPKLKVLWTTTSGLGIGEEEVSGQYCFPVLSRLEVHRCPKLIMKPYFPPSLEVLHLEGCNNQILSLGRSSFPHADEPLSSSRAFDAVPLLKKLELGGIPESIGGLTSLWELRIKDCPALPEAIQHLTSLKVLWIEDCPTLTALPEAIQHLTSLQELWIERCPALTALPEAIQHLTSLWGLIIGYCPALTALPEAIQHLSSLEVLLIEGCPTFRGRRVGDDWHHLLSHIPDVQIH
jgi:Leucine-rich repeat (LRR) protein